MDSDRPRYGLLVSALGAIVLAVSVFLPWYGLSFTATGIALVQQVGSQVAAQFGDTAFQSYAAGLHTDLAGLAGHQITAVSAHQVLRWLNVVLLVIAGLGTLLALVPLARSESVLSGSESGLLAVLGALASLCVVFRMVDPPSPAGGLISLSLREGAWLALLGSLAMLVGALLPRGPAVAAGSTETFQGAWSQLSGWTPET